MGQRIFSILVDNTAGVLSRIAGMFSRRGYNIDSLTVGVTADPRFSRMTIVCNGEEMILEQITRQLEKQIDVRDVKILQPGTSVNHELVMIKVRCGIEDRQNVISVADVFRARIVDIGPESLIIEITGSKTKLEAFISMFDGYEILELARTGITGLSRGAEDVRFLQ